MPKKIDTRQVRQVAELSRLELSEKEVAVFSDQLSEIINYIEKLGELDTENVEPLAHSLPVQNVFREDEPRQCLSRQKALSNAPEADEQFFLIPKILDDGTGA